MPGLGQAVRTALFVALDVGLAFAANEWREARNDAALAEHALDSIREESALNREAAADSRDYHEALQDTLRKRPVAGSRSSPCTSSNEAS